MHFSAIFNNKWIYSLWLVAIAFVVALSYWPVAHAQFVYDDILDFQKMAWLRHGNDWQQFLLRRFNDWVNYFRPLGVALFTLEVRLFKAQPGPMHLVSLLLHLVNTFLVGTLARRTCTATLLPRNVWVVAVPMLLYGLHPLLIEPVVWIGCQFELTATLFMLLGWIANLSIVRPAFRAASIATCFFLAACSKESSLAFPFIIVTFNWFTLPARRMPKLVQLRTLVTEHWATYLAILLAGIAYLLLRNWSLGTLIPSNGTHPLPLLARLQEAGFLYLRYWQMFFWPTVGMGPMHPVPTQQFIGFSVSNVLLDIGAACIFLAAIVLAVRRLYVGGLILCVTFALLPVLHIIGANFDISLYHERYAMTALAVGCAWLPASLVQIPARMRCVLALTGVIVLATWTTLSIATIRVTVPLWSTQVKLWQWALEENPNYVGAEDELISAYIDEGNHAAAWKLIANVISSKEPCTNCILNAAILSVRENKPERASFYLQKIKDEPGLYADPTSYRTFLTIVGQTELLQGHLDSAVAAARAAMALDNLDPAPHVLLAVALAQQGKIVEATQAENAANALLPPGEQAVERKEFDRLLKPKQRTAPKEP